ncbi:MAG: signal recognition particle subunit SRP19/SEC65 family protein, partial [Promethearchaeota archaeon]
MRRRGLTIFWPQYFDKKRPVRLGRRLSLESATEKPTLQDLSQAAQKLKYQSAIDKTLKYPRSTWDEPGAVLIDTMGQKKTFVLHKLAPEVKAAKNHRLDRAKLEKV